ncbi:MAG: hypothetical protein ACXWU1_13235 [Allosphingosinicella sp.]
MTRPANLSYLPNALPAGDAETGAAEPLTSRVARPAQPIPARSGSLVDERLVEEIETLRRYLETANYLLGQDATLRYRYATELTNLRHVEKTLGQIAGVVAAADKDGAIDRLANAELKARLQRKPIAPLFESKH